MEVENSLIAGLLSASRVPSAFCGMLNMLDFIILTLWALDEKLESKVSGSAAWTP